MSIEETKVIKMFKEGINNGSEKRRI